MPRKRLDPTLRYSDVVPVWQHALANGGGTITVDSDTQANYLLHRLNQYRALIRQDAPHGWVEHDRYIVRQGNLCVHIETRPQLDLMARMTRLDGTPLDSTAPPSTAPGASSGAPTRTGPDPAQLTALAKRLTDPNDATAAVLTPEEERTMAEVRRKLGHI